MDASTYFLGNTLNIMQEVHAVFAVVLFGSMPPPPSDLTHRQWLTPFPLSLCLFSLCVESKVCLFYRVREVRVEPDHTKAKKT
jgi:hypothetical protein